MSEDRSTRRRILAYLKGRPLPLVESMPLHISDPADRMVIAFLRMAGESLPWAIGWKIADGPARILSVPEPRNRDLVSSMVAEFGDALISHLGIDSIPTDEEPIPDERLPQVWIGGPTDLDMLHLIALRFARARRGNDNLLSRLNCCGRCCHELFECAGNPFRANCVVASQALRTVIVFPTEPIRTMHLGYLLAMIPDGTLHQRLSRGEIAESVALSTSLTPDVERGLEPLVTAWSKGGDAERESARLELDCILAKEVTRRLDSVGAALQVLGNLKLPVSPSATSIRTQSIRALQMFKKYNARVVGGEPSRSPETDHDPLFAASHFLQLDADRQEAAGELLHHDSLALSDAVHNGKAICGDVVKRELITIPPRTLRVRLTVQTADFGPLRLREGDWTHCPIDTNSSLRWVIQSIDEIPNGGRLVVLQANKPLGVDQEPLQGSKRVVFHEASEPELRRRLAAMVWDLDDRLKSDALPSRAFLARLRGQDRGHTPLPSDVEDD